MLDDPGPGSLTIRVIHRSISLEVGNIPVKKLNTTFLQNFPESTLAFLNIGVNGAAFYDLLFNNEEFRRNVSLAKADEVKSLFASFDGDISIGLINVTLNSVPTFAAYADAKNGNALKALYDNKKQLKLGKNEDIIQLGENEYVYKSRATNVFFGIRNKQMYATNDELLYKSISKPVEKSIKDAGYVWDAKMYSLLSIWMLFSISLL